MSIENTKLPGGAQPQKHGTKYSGFKGVDFASDPMQIDLFRSPWAKNIVCGQDGYPEKRPGYRPVWDMLKIETEEEDIKSLAERLAASYFEDYKLPKEAVLMIVEPVCRALEFMFCVRSLHRCIFDGQEHLLAEINGRMYRILPKAGEGGTMT